MLGTLDDPLTLLCIEMEREKLEERTVRSQNDPPTRLRDRGIQATLWACSDAALSREDFS